MTINHIETAVTAMKTRFKTAPVPERIRLAKCLLAFDRYLAKANSHHDGMGRFAASETALNSLPAAAQYYQDHIAGVWRLTIQRKAGNFDVNVNFNENQDHAYTKTNKDTGQREFDAVRAEFMPKMLDTISAPDVILQNGNRDLFIEKQMNGVHYAVVLEWKDSAKEYRFRSAHCWDKAEYESNLKNYLRPAPHGKKTMQKKAPERLSKSSGADSTFTHLRDSTALMQSPPKHNSKSSASLVNPIGLGGELAETSSCYPKASIDRFTDFVKAIDWQTIAIEPLQKANSHHDGMGRFAKNNDNHPYLPKSDDINTLQEAKAYFSNHIAGHWRITIHRKSGYFSAQINFNENQNHAYTKADKTTGKRNFDQQRARLMQHLIDTISKPDIILENGNRDLYIEKQKTGSYYAVVLEWRNDANEYRFRSAHCWDKKEYDRNVQTYRRPKARGFKLEKNKAPEQLKKSFGASTAFTRLRDMIEELQPSPDCRSVVGQLNESGWELAETSSCSPTISIDGFTDFVKTIDWQTIAIEPLHKANSHHDKSGRFAASDDEPVRLAPNGKPSNLNAEQYAQVRTPEFKQWFGDWEKQAQKKFLLGEPIVALSGDEFQKADIPLTKRVTKWFEENYGGKVNNPVIGNVLLNERGVKDSISHGLSKTKAAAFAAVPEIVKNGMVISSEENWKGRGYDGFTLAAPISIRGDAFVGVVIVHRDKQTQRFYLQEVILREKLQPGTSFKTEALTGNKAALNGDSHTGAIGSLLHDIFNVKASNAVDENGEPLPINGDFATSLPNEPLHKAHAHDNPHDIFKPHENPFIRGLVEDYYESGMIRFSGIRVALNQWLAGQRYRPKNAGLMPPLLRLSSAQPWSTQDTKAVVDYLSGIEPEAFSINDYALLAKLLVNQYLPEDVLIDAAITHAAQSYLMGAAQSAWQASHPDDTITDAQLSALRTALPTALESIATAMRLSGVAKATLDYGTARAAENIVALTDEARATIQATLMTHELNRLSGDASATAKKLEQTLFDNFADMNRDWRRIALTETGELSLQGFVAAQPVGAKLKRIEHYDGACHFCKKIDGTVMEVVDPESPDKDGKTQIWVGKTNIGRSASPRKRTEDGLVDREEHELWWLASGVIHPHCRGIWVRVPG